MKRLIIFITLIILFWKNAKGFPRKHKSSCGIDNSPVDVVYEGLATIETYPWLGILYYPVHDKKRYTTAVVLVTRQIVLGAATEIDEMPKTDFRKRAKVVLGHNCSGPDIGIRDYAYHPEYSNSTYSALAIIQLEVDFVGKELRPICEPPTHLTDSKFYAMVLSDDCQKSAIKIYKMQYVPQEECHAFYRRSGLDVETMWPSHTACARSLVRGHCVWRSGAILVVKQGRRWRLLGFGVYGPGCEAPARFLDYGMYHKWVWNSVARIGRPAITTIDESHVILRRTLSKVQRFGLCDPEETRREIYTDRTSITHSNHLKVLVVKYNISLYANVDYSCVVFEAKYDKVKASYYNTDELDKPKLKLRRWCAGPPRLCHGFQFLEIHFSIEISFKRDITYHVAAYGREAQVMDVKTTLMYLRRKRPHIATYNETVEILKSDQFKDSQTNKWFYKSDG